MKNEPLSRAIKLQQKMLDMLLLSAALSALFIAPLLYLRDLSEHVSSGPLLIVTPILLLILYFSRAQFSPLYSATAFAVLMTMASVTSILQRGSLGAFFLFMLVSTIFLVVILPFRKLIAVCLVLVCINGLAFWLHGAHFVAVDIDVLYAFNNPFSIAVNFLIAVYALFLISFVIHKYGEAFSALVDDLSAEKAKFNFVAEHDRLTGLPNSGVLQYRAEKIIDSALRADDHLAILFVDVEGLKLINKKIGHDAGDFLLKHISSILKSFIKEEELVARIGGSEFLLLLSGVEKRQDVVGVVQSMIKLIAAPIAYEGHELQGGCSIGVALFPEHGSDLGGLRWQAYSAMYQARRSGSNNYAFVAP